MQQEHAPRSHILDLYPYRVECTVTPDRDLESGRSFLEVELLHVWHCGTKNDCFDQLSAAEKRNLIRVITGLWNNRPRGY